MKKETAKQEKSKRINNEKKLDDEDDGNQRRETQRQRVMESWEEAIRILVVFVSNNAKLSNWVDKSNGSSFRSRNSITIRARSFFFPGRWRIAFSFFGGG